MRRLIVWLGPVAVAAAGLALTQWLYEHELQSQEHNLRSTFEFGRRQAAARVEERVAGYEQMLRGVRGLFEASDVVTREDFTAYVDSLLSGAGFAGLRSISFAPLRVGEPDQAPLAYAAPVADPVLTPLRQDLLADPVRRAAMLLARDSGSIALTQRLPVPATAAAPEDAGFVLFMPLYAKRQPRDSAVARRAHVVGWVMASFRVSELMSSLYGDAPPGLDVRVHDGTAVSPASRIYPRAVAAEGERAPRFQGLEYISFGGHTWTLQVRSGPEFERRNSADTARVIEIAGTGLSLLLALLTWQGLTARERAHSTATRMTRELRSSAQRYQRIVETANEGIWTVDAAGSTTFVNPKMQQMLGLDATAMQGRPWTDFMDEAGRRAMSGPGLDRLRSGQGEQREIRFHRADGSDLWATVSTSPVLDEAGRYAGALAMVTDVTERKQAESQHELLEGQLRQAQKMEAIGTLAGGIAHDFNNILAAILGNAALAQQDLPGDHPARARLAHIDQAGGRGRSLVQQIVAFSRQQPATRVPQPLQPLLEESARLLRATLPALVELELRLSESPLWVNADATQLQQVLMNLCTNAWHAMASGSGRILIGLDAARVEEELAQRLGGPPPGRYAHLWVSDNGSGMDEGTRGRIFEPFFTTKPVGQGTGLGLSVVHGIITAHGGAITVSSSPGQGSTFDLWLPLVSAGAPTPPPLPQPLVPRGQGEHVLYVDDDPVMVVMVQGLLERAGYRVSAIDDPRQALQRATATEDAVDLVVTDFNMPELSGLDLARALQRRRPALPVLLSSGYVSDALRMEAAQAGVHHVMQKEYTLEQLVGLVHAVLAARAGEIKA
jgi:PAS domain S-box-containing protein